MFELLPENVRKIAQKKYIVRLLTLYSIGLLSVFIISIALLVPSYVFINLKEGAVISEIKVSSKNFAKQDTNTIKSFLGSAKAKITSVESSVSFPPVLGAIDLILSKVSSGILINSISFNRGADNGKNKASIQGIATTRDNLIHFSDRLKLEKKFTKIDLPVSSFVKNKDVNFSINIEGTF